MLINQQMLVIKENGFAFINNLVTVKCITISVLCSIFPEPKDIQIRYIASLTNDYYCNKTL